MKTTVIPAAELGAGESAIWRSFQQVQPELGSPYMAPELVATVAKVRPGTRVAILEDAGEIIGFFPFERRALGYGVPVAPGLTGCQGVVHAPDAVWDAHDLLRECGLGVWEFDHLVDGQKPFERFQVLRAKSPVIDLSEGSAALLANLRRRSTRVAKKLPKVQRQLERDFGPVRCDFETTDPEKLRMLMAWKSDQYRWTGRTDQFARPWVTRFISDLFDLQSPHFSLVLSVLHAGDRPIAADVYLRRGGVMSGWFTSYDPEFAKYSPGMLHRLALIEAAAASGVRRIDLGRGAYDHKELFKTHDVIVGEGRVLRASAGAALYYAGRAPMRNLRQSVMESPRLYRSADAVLRGFGRVHSTLTVPAHAPGPTRGSR
jgi:CelD/BcsL family acetyltransferase involved in cellulose biosynthesis